MLRPGKVATPATAATLAVPSSTPMLGGLVPIATVMVPVKPVAVLPRASQAVTCTTGANVAPAAASLGSTVNTSMAGPPALIVKAADVAPVSPVAVAVSVYPALTSSMLSP